MILPEVLINQSRVLEGKESVTSLAKGQTGMTINVLMTMAVTFAVAVAALLALAGSSLNEAIVAGAVAMGAAFINLVRRPPDEADEKLTTDHCFSEEGRERC